MSTKLVIGLDGHASGERALAFGADLAKIAGGAELVVAYVIEWSPYSFQTVEENEKRHMRREEEISMANERIVAPAVESLKSKGLTAVGVVRHGDVAQALGAICKENGGSQIIVARSSEGGFVQRVFGSSTSNLVMSADVPVTVVN